MKGLIWFMCVVANAVFTIIFNANGILLGAIPTMILFGTTFWLARTLCKKWDENKWRGDNDGKD